MSWSTLPSGTGELEARLIAKEPSVLPVLLTVHCVSETLVLAGLTLVMAGLVIAGLATEALVIAGLVMAGLVIAGLTTLTFPKVWLVIAGFVMAGLVIAGFVMAGLVIAGLVIAGLVTSGFRIVELVSPPGTSVPRGAVISAILTVTLAVGFVEVANTDRVALEKAGMLTSNVV